jgi:hypothetical protein
MPTFSCTFLLCSDSLLSRAVINCSPYSARTSSLQRPSCRRSSSRTNHLLRRVTPASRSPAASCCSRRMSPYLQPCTSRVETTGTRFPSRSFTQRQTHSYALPLELALMPAVHRHPEAHGHASSRARFGSRTSTGRKSREHLRTSLRAGAPARQDTSLHLLPLQVRRRRTSYQDQGLRVSRDWTGHCSCELLDSRLIVLDGSARARRRGRGIGTDSRCWNYTPRSKAQLDS